MMRNALAALLLLAACTTTTAPLPARAPWRSDPIARAEIPPVYVTEWEKAENRSTCALVVPRRATAQTPVRPYHPAPKRFT